MMSAVAPALKERTYEIGRPHGGGVPVDYVPQGPFYSGRFGRMFPHLLVFQSDEDELRRLGDAMQEQEPQENPFIPAGFTYLGQFVDHDITFDPTSSLQRANDPERLENFRTPRFDLDSLYGRGRHDSAFMYDRSQGGIKLLLGKATFDDGSPAPDEDLARNAQGIAIIGDPRNDENTFVSQMQVLFIKFHNRCIDLVEQEGRFSDPDDIFKEAQRIVRWHYQWIVVHEFLTLICGSDVVDDVFPIGDRVPSAASTAGGISHTCRSNSPSPPTVSGIQ